MYPSGLILFLLANQGFAQTATTTNTSVSIKANIRPTTTHGFEILTTTVFLDSGNPDIHNVDGALLSPRDVCGKAIYSGEAISFLNINCPDTANCATPTACYCPGCCPEGAECTGCPPSSVFMDAGGKLTTTCKTAQTLVVTRQAQQAIPTTLSSPEVLMTASLAEATSTSPISESLPTPSATIQQDQAALRRGVVQPFAWLSRLLSSMSVRLAQALPIKIRESSAAGKVYGSSLHPESAPRTGSESAVKTLAASSSKTGGTHRERWIGDDKNKHQHLHRHPAARNLDSTSTTNSTNTSTSSNGSSSSTLPVSVTATTWFTTTSTSTLTVTVVSSQDAAESTKACNLRRRRGV